MDSVNFYRFPSHFIVAEDAVQQIPLVLKEFRLKSPVVLVTDRIVWKIVGEDVFNHLQKKNS